MSQSHKKSGIQNAMLVPNKHYFDFLNAQDFSVLSCISMMSYPK